MNATVNNALGYSLFVMETSQLNYATLTNINLTDVRADKIIMKINSQNLKY